MSAIEEIASLLEKDIEPNKFINGGATPPQPVPGQKGVPADATIVKTGDLEPQRARECLRDQGVRLSAVHYEATRWRVYVARDTNQTLWMVAFGVIQFSVGTRVGAGSVSVDRDYWIRRYVTVTRYAGDHALRLRVLPDNLMVVSRER